eukprot:1159478-Pelagomonas_calceolata.AAC.16
MVSDDNAVTSICHGGNTSGNAQCWQCMQTGCTHDGSACKQHASTQGGEHKTVEWQQAGSIGREDVFVGRPPGQQGALGLHGLGGGKEGRKEGGMHDTRWQQRSIAQAEQVEDMHLCATGCPWPARAGRKEGRMHDIHEQQRSIAQAEQMEDMHFCTAERPWPALFCSRAPLACTGWEEGRMHYRHEQQQSIAQAEQMEDMHFCAAERPWPARAGRKDA